MLGAPYKNVPCNCQLAISGLTKLTPNFLKCYCAENEKSQSNMRYCKIPEMSPSICKPLQIYALQTSNAKKPSVKSPLQI